MRPIRHWFHRRWLRLFNQRVARADVELDRHRREAQELNRLVDRLLIESESMKRRTGRGKHA